MRTGRSLFAERHALSPAEPELPTQKLQLCAGESCIGIATTGFSVQRSAASFNASINAPASLAASSGKPVCAEHSEPTQAAALCHLDMREQV